ncbi:MAG: 6-phosphogluconate dehydrogenase, partial [Chloroflexota bacterium]
MAIRTVGLLSPGDMGHSIGNVLRHGGLRVITCLRGRGSRSAALAQEAGILDVPDDETLVR